MLLTESNKVRRPDREYVLPGFQGRGDCFLPGGITCQGIEALDDLGVPRSRATPSGCVGSFGCLRTDHSFGLAPDVQLRQCRAVHNADSARLASR